MIIGYNVVLAVDQLGAQNTARDTVLVHLLHRSLVKSRKTFIVLGKFEIVQVTDLARKRTTKIQRNRMEYGRSLRCSDCWNRLTSPWAETNESASDAARLYDDRE